MVVNFGTNVVHQADQADSRLVGSGTLWSEIVAALQQEPRPRHKSGVVIDLRSWHPQAVGQEPAPALYRMASQGNLPPVVTRRLPEKELLDQLARGSGESVRTEPTREIRAALVRAVDGLPSAERTVIGLYYFERLALKEIRTALDVSEVRVAQIHTQAIIHLRTSLSSLLSQFDYGEKNATEDEKPGRVEPRPANAALSDILERFHALSLADESIAIQNGLSANTWNGLQYLGFGRDEIATVVGTSEKTVHRKITMSETLGIAEGDRTMRLIRIMLHAINAIGNLDKGLTWLRRSNRALEGQTPLQSLVTEAGTSLVRRALGVIE